MSDKPSQHTPEIISESSYIATLLQRLVSERLLVDITLPEDTTSYTSTLLQVNPNEGHFLIDDLFPQLADASLSEACPVHITAKLKGAALSFDTTIHSLLEQHGLRLWKLSLPVSVNYQQARSQHRVVVIPLKVPVRLYAGEGVVVRGILSDICGEGLALRVAKSAGLKRGGVYRCSIEHSDEESVEVEVVLSRAVKVKPPLPVLLGAELHNMSSHDLWHWQRFVAEMERRLLRT